MEKILVVLVLMFKIDLTRKCIIPIIERGSYQSIQANSLAFQGPRLFNCLPQCLRDLSGCSVNRFKSKLDKILKTVPDEPQVTGYVQYRRAPSNSIIDMIRIGPNRMDA